MRIVRMGWILCGCLVLAGSLAAQEKGWVDLLEGKDLGQNWTTTGNWKLGTDGVVSLVPRDGEKGWNRFDAYLWSNKEYKDFEIDFEYKVDPKGNSGFYFRVSDVKDPVKKGIEVQIYESASKAKDAKLTDHDSGGIIPGIPPTKNAAKPSSEWNRFQITNKDNKLTVILNGVTVNEVDLAESKVKDRQPVGRIGFQDHGLLLWLRNIKIREL